ncbi:mechanosensitive ion channel family protein [Crenobacter cavernae]|uniref:Small-conductance mechanosensitive channel n=1 Tax=Crenobacter cavernae TaxID=2290923 RepID=A0ABY0FBK1_9NEIS|nr:mechanosensitive ion channel family protein [Crenobacter cavernae]RXZ43427.1 mechanosensitive ion channel family protein [Crenobacter cavernae]
MNGINWSHWTDVAIQVGLNLVAAIVLWLVGRWLIGLATRLLDVQLEKRGLDPTLRRYAHSFLSVTLTIVLIVAILGFFGVETTTFAALIAAAGVAVGLAWSGLLANFAAGLFLITLRPFKVGDVISAAGVTGQVVEIGLFATVINTPDNVRTIVGNNKLFSDNIQNFSANPVRRVDLKAQLANSADHAGAIGLLTERLKAVPNVLADPAPDVALLEFTPLGPVLAVRPYCHPDHYWQVYFDANRVIREELGRAGFPAPEQAMVVRQQAV